MIRIFVETLAPGSLAIAGDEHHYLGRVRRARVGDAIELVDPAGRRAIATIATMTANDTTVTVGEVDVAGPVIPRIQVLVPLIKGDRMDACLEKLVEAGVDHVIVWPAERSVVKLDGDKRQARLGHYTAVLAAGARQSGAPAPAIAYAASLRAAVQGVGEGARLVLDGRAERAAAPSDSLITVVSGPEGGLSPGELDLLAAERFTGFGLGPRVLRAETAPVIAVAILRAATGT
jgi:16S rRNA (uracil1498-N3)-methyltransferase